VRACIKFLEWWNFYYSQYMFNTYSDASQLLNKLYEWMNSIICNHTVEQISYCRCIVTIVHMVFYYVLFHLETCNGEFLFLFNNNFHWHIMFIQEYVVKWQLILVINQSSVTKGFCDFIFLHFVILYLCICIFVCSTLCFWLVEIYLFKFIG